MSRLLTCPAALTAWASLLCLSVACSSEEPGGAGAGGNAPATGSEAEVSKGNGGFTPTANDTPPNGTPTGGTPPNGNGTPPNGTPPNGNGTPPNGTPPNGTPPGGTPPNGTPPSATATTSTTDTTITSAPNNGTSETETTGEGTGSGDQTTSGGSGDGDSSGADDETTTGSTTGETTSTGGPSSGGDCTPNPSGGFVTEGETVLDEKTCLTWMKADVTGHPYDEADAHCANLSLGGHDDWRLPTAGEATTLFHCQGTHPPVYDAFTAMYDGIWTTTETGTIAGDEPKVCGAGQASGQFYDFGKVGAQNTRCVRGPVTVADRADCKTNNQVCQ